VSSFVWCFLDLLRVSSFCIATSTKFEILLCSYLIHNQLSAGIQTTLLCSPVPCLLTSFIATYSTTTSQTFTMADTYGQNTSYPNLNQNGTTQSSNNAASYKDSIINSEVCTVRSSISRISEATPVASSCPSCTCLQYALREVVNMWQN